MQTFVFLALAAFSLFAPASARALQGVTLSWGTSDDPDVAGYNVRYGTQSGDYPNRISAGNVDSTRISGLQEGVTYYFVVTAYDGNGLESVPSNEVVYTVPGESLQIDTITAKTFVLDYSGTVTGPWRIEASEDLWTWRTVAVGTNSSAHVAVLVTDTDKCFLRLKSDTPGVRLIQSFLPDSFPNSFLVTTDDAGPLQWELETSVDLEDWVSFTSATNSPLNAAVIRSGTPNIFFRFNGR